MQQWSVTLTGVVREGVDSDTAWRQVADALGQGTPESVAKIRARLPVSLRALELDVAKSEARALEACGVEAALLADTGERLWVHVAGTTRGPVNGNYARRMLAEGHWDDTTLVCRRGQSRWQPLADVLAAPKDVAAPLAMATPAPPQMEVEPISAPVSSAVAGARSPRANVDESLPTHQDDRELHAGFWRRVLAYVIDGLILGGAVMLVAMPFILSTSIAGDRAAAMGIGLLVDLGAAISGWLYVALFESSRLQATPGKLVLGLRVVDDGGARISFGRATGRYFGMMLSAFIMEIGFMMAGWTARKQGLHDIMAGCCVVRRTGLEQWYRRSDASSRRMRRHMPAWAVVLIVIAAGCVPLAMMAAVAIPGYQMYMVRAQVSSGVKQAHDVRTAVAAYALRHRHWPADNEQAGLADPWTLGDKYVSMISVHRGMVEVTYGAAADRHIRSDHLWFAPFVRSGHVVWRCASSDIADRYLPRPCRHRRH